jgi:hypothetical protein
MWIPSLNAIGLIVIGIGTLLTVLFKKRKTDTTEVTVLGEKNRMQLSRSRVTLLFASALIAAGSILSYFEYQKEIELGNTGIIDKALVMVSGNYTNDFKRRVVENMERDLNLAVLNKQIEREIAQAENTSGISAVIDADSRESSILFMLLRTYDLSGSKNKREALISEYSQYYYDSYGGEKLFRDAHRPVVHFE